MYSHQLSLFPSNPAVNSVNVKSF